MMALQREHWGDSLPQTVQNWLQALDRSGRKIPVADLYSGRSFSEARMAASSASAKCFVVSAGLGIAALDDEVPPYDLTVTGEDSSVNAMLSHHKSSTSDWWYALCSGHGLLKLARRYPDATVLVALPSTYLNMLRHDLSALVEHQATRVRIFTSAVGQRTLPVAVGDAALPYDERLESIAGYAGTRSDFAQRALRHFVDVLGGHELPLDEGRKAVEQALEKYHLRNRRPGLKMDDAEVKDAIRAAWEQCNGQVGRLLRFMRDEAGIACEQGRFSDLWRVVRDERLKQ